MADSSRSVISPALFVPNKKHITSIQRFASSRYVSNPFKMYSSNRSPEYFASHSKDAVVTSGTLDFDQSITKYRIDAHNCRYLTPTARESSPMRLWGNSFSMSSSPAGKSRAVQPKSFLNSPPTLSVPCREKQVQSSSAFYRMEPLHTFPVTLATDTSDQSFKEELLPNSIGSKTVQGTQSELFIYKSVSESQINDLSGYQPKSEFTNSRNKSMSNIDEIMSKNLHSPHRRSSDFRGLTQGSFYETAVDFFPVVVSNEPTKDQHGNELLPTTSSLADASTEFSKAMAFPQTFRRRFLNQKARQSVRRFSKFLNPRCKTGLREHNNSNNVYHKTYGSFQKDLAFQVKPQKLERHRSNVEAVLRDNATRPLPPLESPFELQTQSSLNFTTSTSGLARLASPYTFHHTGENTAETSCDQDQCSILAAPEIALQVTPSCTALPKTGSFDEKMKRLRHPSSNFSSVMEQGQDSSGSSGVCLIDSLNPHQWTTIDMDNLGVTFCVERNHTREVELQDEENTLSLNEQPKDEIWFSMSWCLSTLTKILRQGCKIVETLSGVPVGPRKRRVKEKLIQGLHGTFLPGRLVAILGPSGSGKSTLLNVLAGRLPYTEGHLRINGVNLGTQDLRKFSAFIQQIDLFLPNITVEEHLKSQVRLRLPQNMPEKERDALVRDVMTKFGLFKVRDSLIGSSDLSYGISGGERKRLSVATATLSNPLILLADEPTTGLDSVMAKSVVTSLRCIASSGRTVVVSLHQPNTQTFSMFDEVLLLAGGRIIYFGDRLGSVEWMRRLGVFCSNLTNPSDFLIQSVSLPENPEKRLEKKMQLLQWAKLWETEGDNFLRQWTNGGRFAFFLSSRSFAERSIQLGLLSRGSVTSHPFSTDNSLVSFENDFSSVSPYLTESLAASTQFEDVHPLSDSQYHPDESLKLGSNRHKTQRGSFREYKVSRKAKRKDKAAVPWICPSLDREWYPFPKRSKKIKRPQNLYLSHSHHLYTKDAQAAEMCSLPADQYKRQFLPSFHSAPAVASFHYALYGSNGLDGFTRYKITSRGTKNLLKTFRYSGPRPWGHATQGNSGSRELHYFSYFGRCRPKTTSADCSCHAVIGKPISLSCQGTRELYTTGVPNPTLRSTPQATSQQGSHTVEEGLGSTSRFVSLSQPHSTESLFAQYTLYLDESNVRPQGKRYDTTRKERFNELPKRIEEAWVETTTSPNVTHRAEENPYYDLKTQRHPFLYQLHILTSRALASNRRDPILLYARALQTFVIALMYGSMFFNLKDTFDDARTKVSALFFVLTNQGLLGAAGVCSTFPDEKVVISREQESGFVDSKAYILAKMIADTPIQCIFPVIFNVATMLMMNLCTSWSKMILSCIVALAVCNCAIAVGYLGSAAAPSSDIALVIAQIWVLPALLFSGFIVVLNDIPKFISWLQFLSYFRYGFFAYTHLVFDQATIIYESPLGSAVMSGNAFIKSYLGISIGEISKFWMQVLCLLLMAILLRFIIILLIAPLTKSWKEKPS